jgi:tyrosyl-tRNA synthetase
MNSLFDELAWRGLLYQRTAEDSFDEHLSVPGRVGYCGFDPTADSLTIGNLVPIMLLVHWQRAGHRPLVLMGGATGLIGDPSGKDRERPLLTAEQVEANLARQRAIFERLLDFERAAPNRAEIVNNASWLTRVGYIEFLREVGKHFSVNAMIQKESVRERLERRDQGISYTEFSYMLLQAFDFLHLHRTLGCTVQMAGSDQYGNITAGIDLIHRVRGHDAPAFGFTAPLVTLADGRKVGKSERGAVWLSADRTSPYAFYQYWVNVADADVSSFLRRFTLLAREEIAEIETEHGASPEKRIAQRALAAHMTDLLHGSEERLRVEAASDALFGGGSLESLDAATIAEVARELPHTDHDRSLLSPDGISLVDLLPLTTLASSRREARELLEKGAISLHGRRVEPGYRLTARDLVGGGVALLRRGRKSWHATRWGTPGSPGDRSEGCCP